MLTIHPMYNRLTVKAFLGSTIDPVLLASERRFQDRDMADIDLVQDVLGMFGSMHDFRADVTFEDCGIVIAFAINGDTARLQNVSDQFATLLWDITKRHLQAVVEPIPDTSTGRLLFR